MYPSCECMILVDCLMAGFTVCQGARVLALCIFYSEFLGCEEFWAGFSSTYVYVAPSGEACVQCLYSSRVVCFVRIVILYGDCNKKC